MVKNAIKARFVDRLTLLGKKQTSSWTLLSSNTSSISHLIEDLTSPLQTTISHKRHDNLECVLYRDVRRTCRLQTHLQRGISAMLQQEPPCTAPSTGLWKGEHFGTKKAPRVLSFSLPLLQMQWREGNMSCLARPCSILYQFLM